MTAALVLAALAGSAGVAVAQDVEIPTSVSRTPAQGAAPAPTAQTAAAAAPAPAPAAAALRAPARVRTKPVVLRLGARGAIVRDLQRELRRRGARIAVDGAFGPATKRAVKQVQRRFRMKPTGVANARLMKRLGLRTRMAAGAPRAATRAAVVPGASRYLDVFPVGGQDYTYSDDYGAARHQGSHEGTDIMADRGTPLVAVTDATVSRLTRRETGLGGIYVWLQRADGTDYYYAHMTSIAAGLQEGSRVTAGQVIGTVGNTGDARYGATHLHFEIRPAGSRPINPYSHLVAVDPTARTQARDRR
ncbi:M23 family metallopeptidase [Miltoncostaea marina]|uniref:M23 family metallopeptidase n=1 Tax=Miltoncostaea marina TaxID=2843215 RepID=UPI001C3D2E0F|nr:peptidoglycan DD-metalloendopeptidase family protein [Miltoncostaea marina]